MTVVIARKFGHRVAVAADTMISDRSLGRADAIPGRLKAVVLNATMSVAYAGHAEPALDSIRRANAALLASGEPEKVENILLEAAADSSHDVEFITVRHIYGVPELKKITARGITSDLDAAFLGDAAAVGDVLSGERAADAIAQPDMGISAEEIAFWSAFNRLFVDRGILVREAVGGIPTCLIASPHGHTYQGCGISMAWDAVDLRTGITAEQHLARHTGASEWRFSVISSRLRGVAVLGLAIPQAGVGFIYSPLADEALTRIDLELERRADFLDERPLHEAISRVVERVALEGGGVPELTDGEEQIL